ncbi:hypothetical protein ACFL6K_02060 [Candidatus Latescibacterota bacterium]
MRPAILHIIRIIFILLAFSAVSFSAVYADETSPFQIERVMIYGDGSSGPYSVEKDFIGGSAVLDSLSRDIGLSISESDNLTGSITFSRPLADGDSVAVNFAVPPPWLKKTYQRSSEERRGISAPDEPFLSAREKTPGHFPGLSFGGSKTFDVNVGSGNEAALNQTLRLNITGKLTDDITLNAAISDQNVPISPEGDTRELEEIDRIMIELTGKNFSAEMGDTDLIHEGGRWQSYERRLSGAKLTGKTSQLEFFASGAASEGRHTNITITPVDGNQGPYRLIADNGRQNISLIPGTENIWINGEQLTRGNRHDYTVDYTTGEIIFTEQRIIGSDMRIVCDYEYTSESYRRNFYSAGANGEFVDKRLKIGLVFAREADDYSKPVLYDIDESVRNVISQAGDAPVYIEGIRPAEADSSGLYDEVDGHLVYNPAGTGKFNATFSWVGENTGSYRYLGGGIYEFVAEDRRGPGSGASYTPKAFIQSPVSHDLAGINLSFAPVQYINIETEAAGSSVDNNTKSDIDDSDNGGSAHRIGIDITPEFTLGIPLKVDIAGSYRSQESAFSPLDRDRTAEENRRWGLPLIQQSGKETMAEYSGGIAMAGGIFSGSGFSVEGGQAERVGTSSSKRIGGTSTFIADGIGGADLSVNHILRNDFPGMPDEEIDRINFKANGTISGFLPSFNFEREQVEGTGNFTHGSSYDDFRSNLITPELFGVTGEFEWLYRKEQAKQTSWSDSSLVRGGSIGLSTAQGTSGSFKTKYSRRERKTGSNLVSTDQAVFDYFYRPEGGIFRLDGTYRAGRSREASKRKNYIYTGSTRGGYRWEDENDDGIRDPDEFIPDEHGSYYLYEERLEDYSPVNIVSAYGRVGIDVPGDILRKITGKKFGVKTETSFEINEKSSAPSSDVFLLNMSEFRKAGVTTSGDARIQEDITVPISGGAGSVRLRFFKYNTFNGEYVSGAERKGQQELSIRLRLPVTEEYDTEFTVKNSKWSRYMDNRSTGNYRVNSVFGDAGISYYPAAKTTLGMNLGGGIDNDGISTIRAIYYTVKPSAVYRFTGKGRIEASYTLTSVSLDNFKNGMRLPYTMAQGRKDGRNHDISLIFDYRLSDRMNLIVTYTGRKFADQNFENFARAQIRALF